MRGVLALIAGIFAAAAVMIAVGAVGSLLYPFPGAIDPRRAEEAIEVLSTAPVGAQIWLLFAWFAGPLAGAAVAKAVSGMSWPGWTLAGVWAALLAFAFFLPFPVWMQALAFLAPLLGGLFADMLVAGRPPAAEAAPGPNLPA
jgi:hypothetical protein